MSNVKNYTEQGGEKTVIGGTLAFTDDAVVENMPGGGSGYTLPIASEETLGGIKIGGGLHMVDDTLCADFDQQMDYMENSTATTLEQLVADFNELLFQLQGSGFMWVQPSSSDEDV